MITDGRTLAGMARQGFIDWKPGTSRHWTGQTIKTVYVEDAGPKLERWNDVFTYRGKQYRLRYVDGCFKPFVFAVEDPIPGFV